MNNKIQHVTVTESNDKFFLLLFACQVVKNKISCSQRPVKIVIIKFLGIVSDSRHKNKQEVFITCKIIYKNNICSQKNMVSCRFLYSFVIHYLFTKRECKFIIINCHAMAYNKFKYNVLLMGRNLTCSFELSIKQKLKYYNVCLF
jgi:hypothetical protein